MAKSKSKTKPGDLSDEGKALKDGAGKWLDKIGAAGQAEKDWLDAAAEATIAYMGSVPSGGSTTGNTGKVYDFNILHSNVETIVPAIINSPPVPDIRRRFGDADEPARQVAELIERAIMVQVDDSQLEVELEAEAQDGFLAGRGVIRLRFMSDDESTSEPNETDLLEMAEDKDADAGPGGESEYFEGEESPNVLRQPVEQEPDPLSMAALGSGTALGGLPADLASLLTPDMGGPSAAPAVPNQTNERITFEAVSWRDFRHGPAKRWDDVPWVAFRHSMEPDDADEFADASLLSVQAEPGDIALDRKGDIVVWEVWCKKTRTVKFIREADRKIIKRMPDPLGLTRFFPIADPVQPISVTGNLGPVCPFTIYKNLADELDRITKRIRKLTEGLKARGLFIGRIADLATLSTLDDNEIAPVEDVEQFAANGGLDNAITWWPIDKIITVVVQLYNQREAVKQSIYEITGISDIVRGASRASETLGAQQIKTQWGSLRIQRLQRMIERSARDLFVMMSEIIPAKFSNATLEAITGIKITPEMDALMRDKLSTRYRVNVESDSTVRADTTRRKGEMAEFLSGSGAYFNAVGPLVQNGSLPAEIAIGIYVSTARMFKLGKSIEDALEGMVKKAQDAAKPQLGPDGQPLPPPQKPPTAEEMKAQAMQQLQQQDAAANAEINKAKVAKAQAEAKEAAEQAETARLVKESARVKLAMDQQEALNAGVIIQEPPAPVMPPINPNPVPPGMGQEIMQ